MWKEFKQTLIRIVPASQTHTRYNASNIEKEEKDRLLAAEHTQLHLTFMIAVWRKLAKTELKCIATIF